MAPRRAPYRYLLWALTLMLGLVPLLSACRASHSLVSAPGRTTLLGDPDFTEEQLAPEARQWYQRFLFAATSPLQYPDAIGSAASGDLYQLGRIVNVHVSTLLAVYRATGDLRLLDEMDRVMEPARATLRDTNEDGYRNWRWLKDPGNRVWYGDDTHVMDEAMTHGLIAAVAWAYQVNRDVASPMGVPYGERADFWADYLLNDFDPKWRDRDRITTGYDYLFVELMHPHLQRIRYFYYMGLLTGDPGFDAQAKQLADGLLSDFHELHGEAGPALVWSQGVQAVGSYIHYLQPTIYAGYTTQTLYELAIDGLEPFADAVFLEEVAATLAQFVIDNGSRDFAIDVGGNEHVAGFDPAPLYPADPYGFSRMTDEQYAIQAFGLLAPFDDSGTIVEVSRQLYDRLEDPDAPQRIYAPAAIFLFLNTMRH